MRERKASIGDALRAGRVRGPRRARGTLAKGRIRTQAQAFEGGGTRGGRALEVHAEPPAPPSRPDLRTASCARPPNTLRPRINSTFRVWLLPADEKWSRGSENSPLAVASARLALRRSSKPVLDPRRTLPLFRALGVARRDRSRQMHEERDRGSSVRGDPNRFRREHLKIS